MERCDRAALREPADPQHGRADRLLPRLLSARENEGLSGAELFLRSSGEAVLSHILYITGRVPEQAYLLGQFGRLTVLSCGAKRRWSHLL